MTFWAYMLRCSDGTFYTGHTDDLEHRMAQHSIGLGGRYTSSRMPVELVWCSDFATRYEALESELRVKNWSKAKKEGLIAGDWNKVSHFAEPPARPVPRPDVSTSSTSDRHERESSKTPVRVERGSSAAENPSRDPRADAKPVIVLIRPQLGENIGKAARAMLNFGLTELRLVEPRDGWPNPAAGPAASGADLVLKQAQVFATTAEAVADCAHVYATTVRKRGVTKPVLTPEAAARDIHASPGRSAFLFGPERSGLETSDVALARAIVTVPINPAFGSLNLAQAVILLTYEWSKHVPSGGEGGAALIQPTGEELLPPATQNELEGLIEHFTRLLTPKGYFLPLSRAEATQITLRTMLTKPGWNHLEIRTLRGVLSALERTEQREPR